MTFIYETTIELDGPEYEVRFLYTVQWGQPQTGPTMENSGGQPEEYPSAEIQNIHVLTETMSGKDRWFDATPEQFEDFCNHPSDDDLLENAREQLND